MSSARPMGQPVAELTRPAGTADGTAPVALYVHVPFCVSLCPYCDFVVNTGWATRGPRQRIDDFVRALRVEIDLRADALDARFGRPAPSDERPVLETVYLGGGTPSLLSASVVGNLLDQIDRRFGLAADAEVTIEANPGPEERGDLAGFRSAGVTRVSLGAQSFDPVELRRLGRRHDPADVMAAVEAARAAGVRSVNLDLLYDVPGQSFERWVATLEAALDLEPDHLSLYALTLDDPDAEGLTGPSGDHLATRPGARRWRERARADQDDDRAAEEYLYALERLSRDGWRSYEISNFARPSHECRHNLIYWQRRPYEAVGPGAHAFDGVARRWNAARLDGYLAALIRADEGRPRLPPGDEERLDVRTAAAERVILGLRTDDGVPVTAASEAPLSVVHQWAAANGLLERGPDGGRLRLTPRGRLLSNELFARLV